MVSGGICSAVPFIPNGVEILKKHPRNTLNDWCTQKRQLLRENYKYNCDGTASVSSF